MGVMWLICLDMMMMGIKKFSVCRKFEGFPADDEQSQCNECHHIRPKNLLLELSYQLHSLRVVVI